MRLAEWDEAVGRAVALYLTEKVKNGTPRQREIAKKSYKDTTLFQIQPLEVGILNWL